MYLPRRNSLGWRYLWMISSLVAGLMILNFFWTSSYNRNTEFNMLREKAEILLEQFIAMRSFIAQNQDRINSDSHGNFEFKHLNPAAVGKGVGDIFAGKTQYSIKQTRLHARNPGNAPDEFEKEVLARFAADRKLTEVHAEAMKDGKRVYRYVVPLYVEEACLNCHGEPAGSPDIAGYPREGLKPGELAGAISLVVPTDTVYAALARSRNNLLAFSLLLLLVTITGILFVTSHLVVRPLEALTQKALAVGKGELDTEFDDIPAYGEVATLAGEFASMLAKLKDLYKNMERNVLSRTRELEAANLRLVESKKALTQLNQKLSEHSRLKSEFLATVTHELKTPLTSITAFCELLLDEVTGPINAEQKENLLDIKTSAQQLMILINDILDMAKFEAGALRLDREKVDVNDVFRMVRRTMSSIAYQNGIGLNVERANIPLVLADPERLCQMINNLVSNAIKHSREGGQIRVRAGAENCFALISVEDTGEGIAPELLPHIFEKFRQGEESLKRRRSGTGLGLALVKTLAELQGGSVAVSSEIGKGSTFTIRIPLGDCEGGENGE